MPTYNRVSHTKLLITARLDTFGSNMLLRRILQGTKTMGRI